MYALLILLILLIALCGAIFMVVLHNAINGDIEIQEWEDNNNNII